MANLRKYLIAGLLVWLPLAATVFVIRVLITLMDRTILLIPPEWRPENVLGFSIPGFGVIVGIFILLITGMFAANLFGRRLVSFWESILGRIPLVRSIYSSVKQVTETLFSSNSKSFRKVVLIEFPRQGTWSVGFVSNRGMQKAIDATGQELVSVFVSTTPNPTTGFLMMVPASELIELDLTIEEAFKYIISMGVVVPEGPAKEALINGKLAQKQTGS
ncbi:MAG: hypothetical protein A2W76_06115 [Gammaproteobacteria bacterium RIFCSPLOWO2_12_47_11]|jgi:uncharacterized membrane protein|nr:MAG: hypothetical protein A2W76_06115 [Gammaproteobacteria bacterium RIFCSPLOWO2_12_47_11]